MKLSSFSIKNFTVLSMLAASLIFTGCNNKNSHFLSSNLEDSLRLQVKNVMAENAVITANLIKFDTLDFTVFTNQEWTRLHESHSKVIKVNWPDGHYTMGIERHIEDLKAMFVYAPNTSIKEHPIHFGSGNMTCVVGVMTGTFTEPMPVGHGKYITPTGKSFILPMCTVGIWKGGVMIEEYLFWDNQTYMKQIGIEK